MRELKQTWRDLLLVFRIALDVRKLLVGLLMLLTTLVVGALLLGVLMWETVDYQRDLEQDPSPEEMARFANLMLVEREYTFPRLLRAAALEQDMAARYMLGQVGKLTVADLGMGEWAAYYEPRGLTTGRVLLLIGAALLLWLLLAPQLGSLCRIAAMEIARDERLELATANRFARKKWGSLFFAPVMLWAFVALIFLLIALWGLVGSIPWVGPIVAVLLLPFVLFGGFLMVLALLGFVAPAVTWLAVLSAAVALILWLLGATTAEGAALTTVAVMLSTGGVLALVMMIVVLGGSPLIAPALATEGTDSFDSLSRAYNYFFSRFWHFVGYTVVGTVFGILCVAFVWAFTTLILALAFLPAQWAWGEPVQRFLWALTFQTPELYLILSLGAEVPREGGFAAIWEADGFSMWLFALLGLMMVAVVVGFALAFAVAYTTTMWTMIYFLLRHGVDGTDAQEIFVEEELDHWLAPPAEVEKRLGETATAHATPASPEQEPQPSSSAEAPQAAASESTATAASADEKANGNHPPDNKAEKQPNEAPEEEKPATGSNLEEEPRRKDNGEEAPGGATSSARATPAKPSPTESDAAAKIHNVEVKLDKKNEVKKRSSNNKNKASDKGGKKRDNKKRK